MITLIHGDDTTLSREAYRKERVQAENKKIVDGASISLTDLVQLLSGDGLFGTQDTIFIEELVSKRKSQKESEELLLLLQKQTEAIVVLWESKELSAKQVGLLKGAVVKLYKVPTVVFSFLDSIKPGNTKQMLTLYHQVVATNDPSYVLFMLIRHVRILLALTGGENTISETARMAPWQKGKMEKIARSLGETTLLEIHQRLFDLEQGAKTGNLSLSLGDAIDFFLACL